MEFPNTNIVRNVPRLPNSSANYWGQQSIWTHLYWPQPAHSHRQNSPTRAQLKGSSCSSAIPSSTRGVSFRAQLKECHVLNPYPKLNSRDTFWATTQRTPASRPIRFHRSLVDHATNTSNETSLCYHQIAWHCSRGVRCCRFRSPGGGRVPPSAKRLWNP